jgi:DNA (cytosine-5)-methyltransferase 1
MKHGSLFSGIGGFDLAAEWMGWENIFHCEISEFPRKILKYHFPKSICYEDIKKTDFTKHRGEIDIISGGFPCQPYSNAGKRKGKDDDRHLWPEMLRVIREIQPRFVVGENVAGLLSWNNGMVFHEIITDLENEGYETQAFLIPACATNAPHRRDRIWFIAHSNNARTNERMQFDGERKENDEQWRGQSQSEYRENGINGITPDTDGTEQGNNLGENIGQEGEIRRGKEGDVFGELCSDGNVADTESQRAWEQSSEDRGREDRRFDNYGKEGNVADTNCKRHEERNITTESIRKARFNSEKNFTNYSNWENFPTQSPICGGDDGIPTELDGITFPKWRNESIKGYGNAVVPQVVYQIFKAIQKTNQL